MKEENNGTQKNKLSRIFRKKWFFPAVYLTIAALLLTAVVWYQNLDNQIQETEDRQEQTGDVATNQHDQDAETVVSQQEIVQMPVENPDKAEIVTKFYDYNADEKDQESALVFYNNRYYQSTGVDIASPDGESFNVTASLSGTVTNVKEDPLLGKLVELTHEENVTTYYASLGEISVKAGDEVKQGEVIGTAGKNLFGKDSGTHVHFEIRKDGQEVNPEEFFNQPVSSLVEASESDESQGTDESETSDESNTTDESDATETEESESTDESNATEESDATNEGDSDATNDEQEQPTNGSEENEDPTQEQEDETDVSDGNPTDETSDSSASSVNA